MEKTQHNNVLLLHGTAPIFFRSARGLIIPPVVGLLRILWKHNGSHQGAKHWADETGGPHTGDSRLRTNDALKAATEDVRSGWFRSRPHTSAQTLGRGGRHWVEEGGGGGHQRIGVPLRVSVVRLLGWTVGMRRGVLWRRALPCIGL